MNDKNIEIITLMNKTKKILDFQFDKENGIITTIDKIYDLNYAPLNFKNRENLKEILDTWLDERIYITNRFYQKQNIITTTSKLKKEILSSSNILSLSDQYWINHQDDEKKWEDINFFENDFNQIEINDYSSRNYHVEQNYKELVHCPTTTVGGQVQKTWIIDSNNHRCLLKSSNTFQLTEPINEKYASKVGKILKLSVVDYDIRRINSNGKRILVSTCNCFITRDTEIIPAKDIIKTDDTFENIVNEYKNILTNQYKIKDANIKIDKMILLDTLLISSDRHLNNFGVIRDVNTLEIIDVAPIFDNGRILGATYSGFDFANYNVKDFDFYIFGKEVKQSELEDYLKKNIILDHSTIEKLKLSILDYKKLLNENKEYIRVNDNQADHLISIMESHFARICELLSNDVE